MVKIDTVENQESVGLARFLLPSVDRGVRVSNARSASADTI
jgi:hypothetical protein